MNTTWNKAKTRIKQTWEEQPLVVVMVATAAAGAAAQVIKASTEASNSRTWAKEVDRRDRKNMQEQNGCNCR